MSYMTSIEDQDVAAQQGTVQDSETVTVGDLADEYGVTIQDITMALGDDSLTEDDGVDADQARDMLTRQRIQVGQTWTSDDYGTDHEVSDYAGNGWWEMRGPVGNHHVLSDATLRARYSL